MLHSGFPYFFRKSSHLIYRMFLGSLLVGIAVNSNPARGAPQTPASSSSLLNWDQINPDGFWNANFNTTWSMLVFQNQLFAGTRNPSGAKIWQRNGDSLAWADMSPISWQYNTGNTAVLAMFNHSDTEFTIGTVNASGSQVWRYTGSGWTNLNDNGFGTATNSAVWSISVGGNDILAGTENTSLGTGVFRYQSGGWIQVGSYGFGDPHNTITSSMAYLEHSGTFLGTWNGYSGAEIWLYTGASLGWIKKGGFGDPDNIGARSMAVFNDQLYVGTYNSADGAQIWRYNLSTDTWLDVVTAGFNTTHNKGISVLYPFTEYLYAGTENTTSGAQIWRTRNGTDWELVMNGGFGDPNNTEITSMTSFGYWLIAGTRNYSTGSEVWRSYPMGPNPSTQVSFTSADALYPDLAFNSASGEFLVVWTNWTGSSEEISAQLFDDSGQLIGSQISNIGSGESPQVAFDTHFGNRYLVAWEKNDTQVGIQLLAADGDKIGGEITFDAGINMGLNNLVFSPVTDRYVLLYTVLIPPHNFPAGLRVITLTQGGQVEPNIIVIRSIDNTRQIYGADLAWNHAHNECLVAWSQPDITQVPKIFGVILELATPALLGGGFQISDDHAGFKDLGASVAAMGGKPAGTGTYLVSWTSQEVGAANDDPYFIAGRKVDGNGAMMGATFSISHTPATQSCPINAANEHIGSFFTSYFSEYKHYPEFPFPYHLPFSLGRFLPKYAAYISGEHWLGKGAVFPNACVKVVGDGSNGFVSVISYQGPTASTYQIWATRIGLSQVYLPFIRK